MTDVAPTREDRVSFGLSTVGWQGSTSSAVLEPLDAAEEAGRRGMAFQALDRLALEHLDGVA